MLAAMVELALVPLEVEISQGAPFLPVLQHVWEATRVPHGSPREAAQRLIQLRKDRDAGTMGAVPSGGEVEFFCSWAVLVLGHEAPRLP
jgi:hypothetical protein